MTIQEWKGGQGLKSILKFEQTSAVHWDGPKKTFIHKNRQVVLRI